MDTTTRHGSVEAKPQKSTSLSPGLDLATLPGPLGGCTLVIPAPDALRYHPVTVTIQKNASAVSRPLDGTSAMSAALGRAARVASSSNGSGSHARLADTVEELLEQSHGEGRAKACLAQAKNVLSEIRKAKEEEEQRRASEEAGVMEQANRLAHVVGHHQKPLPSTESTSKDQDSSSITTKPPLANAPRAGRTGSVSAGLGLAGIREQPSELG